jgi:hypothetical protein
MKKYKLIKTYPGSPLLGKVLEPKVEKDNENTNNFYWEGSWFNPNDFPELWEEVIENDYEIISYWSPRFGDTKYLYYEGHEDWDNINKSKYHPIHSVKRLSDGEVFTLGDTIKVSQYGNPHIISRFSLTNDNSSFRNGVWVHYKFGDGCSHIRNATKIKTKVDMNNAELEFIFFMKGTSGSFKTNLFKTIMSADNTNQKKLSLGFPDEVEVVRRYQQEDGYWQELLNIREND